MIGGKVWSGRYYIIKLTGVSEDHSVGIWDPKTYKFLKRLPHDKSVKAIASVNNLVFTGGGDGVVRVSLLSSEKFTLRFTIPEHMNY